MFPLRNRINSAWLLPMLLVLLVMLPRLASPQFGFFDDAITLTRSSDFWSGDWSNLFRGSGRSRPLYWLWYYLLDALSGRQAFWFFVGNLLLLGVATFALIQVARALGATKAQAALAGCLFVASGAVIENAYTLSKGELIQAVWMLLSLLAVGRSAPLHEHPTHPVRWSLLSALCILCACTSKETSILLLPIAFAWWALAWLFSRLIRPLPPRFLELRSRFLLATFLGVGTYLLGSALYLKAGGVQQGYGSNFIFTLPWIKENARLWLSWLRRDYSYVLPLALLPALNLLYKSLPFASNSALRAQTLTRLHRLVEIGVWLSAWLLIYLPWIYAPEYYLLPFGLGVSLLAAYLVDWNLAGWQTKGKLWRSTASLAFFSSAALFVLTLPSHWTNLRLQLAVDAANAEFLQYVVEKLPTDSVLLVNLQPPNEYGDRLVVLVQQIHGRRDIEVAPLDLENAPRKLYHGKVIYLAFPIVENQFYPSFRFGAPEHLTRLWNEAARGYLEQNAQPVFSVRRFFRSFNVNIRYWYCPFTPTWGKCDVPAAPFDRRRFAYGWDVYRLEP